MRTTLSAEKTRPYGAVVVSALVKWEGVRFLETSTYYGYSIREARKSFIESCERLGYKIESA